MASGRWSCWAKSAADTPLGRILGHGAAVAGQVLGVERVPAVKGQAMSAYEPRAIKGTGVTYATSPQGADHTSGLTIRAKVNHLDPKGQADLSRTTQINMAGVRYRWGRASSPALALLWRRTPSRDLLNARYGWEVGTDFLQVLGRETSSWSGSSTAGRASPRPMTGCPNG